MQNKHPVILAAFEPRYTSLFKVFGVTVNDSIKLHYNNFDELGILNDLQSL